MLIASAYTATLEDLLEYAAFRMLYMQMVYYYVQKIIIDVDLICIWMLSVWNRLRSSTFRVSKNRFPSIQVNSNHFKHLPLSMPYFDVKLQMRTRYSMNKKYNQFQLPQNTFNLNSWFTRQWKCEWIEFQPFLHEALLDKNQWKKSFCFLICQYQFQMFNVCIQGHLTIRTDNVLCSRWYT